MWRTQIPLAPEPVRTVQTAQGLTMDSAVMMLQTLSTGMNEDDWWMHLYVMLSRVRTSKQILVFDVPPKHMFERGPPKWVQAGIQRLMHRAVDQIEVAAKARKHLGWVPRRNVDSHHLSFASVAAASSAGASGNSTTPTVALEVSAPGVVARGGSRPAVEEHSMANASSAVRPFLTSASGDAWMLPAFRTKIARAIPAGVELYPEFRDVVPREVLTRLWPEISHAGFGDALYTTQHQLPLRGLLNLGNTCFVNAVCQVLLRVDAFCKLVRRHKETCQRPENSACGICAFDRLLDGVMSGSGNTPSGCPVAVAVRRGSFGADFKIVHQSDCQCIACSPVVVDMEAVASLPAAKIDYKKGRMCDALEFLEAVFLAMEEVCRDRLAGELPNFVHRFGQRSVLDESLFGGLLRDRLFCSTCGAASDTLRFDSFIRLSFPSRKRKDSLTLKALWEQHFLPTRGDGKLQCPDAPRCSVRGCGKQSFLEREPAILCIILLRGSETYLSDGTLVASHKDRREVGFPERLDFLRSGIYRFLGVVVHHGESPRTGHYTSFARISDSRFFSTMRRFQSRCLGIKFGTRRAFSRMHTCCSTIVLSCGMSGSLQVVRRRHMLDLGLAPTCPRIINMASLPLLQALVRLRVPLLQARSCRQELPSKMWQALPTLTSKLRPLRAFRRHHGVVWARKQ